MTDEQEKPGSEKPLIPSRYAPLIAAGVSVLTTVTIWSMGQVVSLNARLDRLEAFTESLLDEEGSPTPSQTAIRSEVRLNSVDETLAALRVEMDRMWTLIADILKE